MKDGQTWTFRDSSIKAAQAWNIDLQGRIDSATRGTLRTTQLFKDSVNRVYLHYKMKPPFPAQRPPIPVLPSTGLTSPSTTPQPTVPTPNAVVAPETQKSSSPEVRPKFNL